MKAPDFFRFSAVSREFEHQRGVEEAEEDDQREYRIMCTGWPMPRLAATFCSQPKFSEVPNQLAIVAGNSSRLEAKIGGSRPTC